MVLDAIGIEAGSAALGALFSPSDGKSEGVSNNKIGAAIGGVGAVAAITALGITAAPATGVALAVGVIAGSKGESVTKGVVGTVVGGTSMLALTLAGGAINLTGGALGLALYGVKGGTTGIINVFKSDETRLKDGLKYLEQGEGSKAIKIFNKIITKNKQNPIGFFVRGEALASIGETNKAIEDYSQAIKLDSKFLNAYNARGSIFLNHNHYDQAVADFSSSITIDDSDFSVFFNRAKAYVALEEYMSAISDYDKVVELNSDFVETYFLRGCLSTQIGSYQDSVADFSEFLNRGGDTYTGHFQRANSFMCIAQYENAIEDFSKLIELVPDTVVELMFERALCFEKLNKEARAITDYDNILALEPTSANAFFRRGCLKIKTGSIRKGESDLIEAIRQDPQYIEAYISMGYLKVLKKKHVKAIKYFDHAINLSYKASTLERVAELQKQIKSLKKEIKKYPWWKKRT